MTWTMVKETTTAQEVYETFKRHRLLPASEFMSAAICNGLSGADRYTISEEGSTVATVYITDAEAGEVAQLDFVPVTRYFRTGFDDPLRGVLVPLLKDLFDVTGVRRIESMIPASRCRTKRALCSVGFKPEGRSRDGVMLHGKEPEDLRMLGMLKHDLDNLEEK